VLGGLGGAVPLDAGAPVRPGHQAQVAAALLVVQFPVPAILAQGRGQVVGVPGQLPRIQHPCLLQQVGLHPAAELVNDLIRQVVDRRGDDRRVPRRDRPLGDRGRRRRELGG
jgi:hypothetical protein